MTGALSFVTAPDFEAPTDAGGNNVYDLYVIASTVQGGSDLRAIAITVTDINEAPVITSNGSGATAAVSLAENTTAVTTVTTTDPDLGQTLSYSISGGADEANSPSTRRRGHYRSEPRRTLNCRLTPTVTTSTT